MTAGSPAMIRHVEHCMGTVFSFDVRSACDPTAFRDILRWLHWADATFSPYRPDSDISRIAEKRVGVLDCPPQVGFILDLCTRLRDATDGYFDAWATGTLDPSAVVKGWAVDQAHDRLCAAGSTRHCINAGGDIRCVGGRGDGQPWRLGIASPFLPGELVTVVEGFDLALATSGVAERGEHIVDPHIGRPPLGLASLSLVGADLTTVDALSTAAYAMGGAARGWVARRDDVAGFGVTTSGRRWRTAGFPAGRLEPLPGRIRALNRAGQGRLGPRPSTIRATPRVQARPPRTEPTTSEG